MRKFNVKANIIYIQKNGKAYFSLDKKANLCDPFLKTVFK